MSELSSYQVQLRQPLETNQIVKLYKLISRGGCDLYLHQNQLITDAKHLPKLLSFFLCMKMEEPLVLIIGGERCAEIYTDIENLWAANGAVSTPRQQYSEAALKNVSSVFV
ncbi:UNVERIFIED_CONTAM: hypothetical protein N8J90_01485 [Halobacillus marinus]|uniref:hypothetical protein n=1 Tax=Halobacillus sp. KGW1 TaxID=1793726 RepID=UPI000783C06B|nr:hypothetical protein [Halobacillus sp. KGW1]